MDGLNAKLYHLSMKRAMAAAVLLLSFSAAGCFPPPLSEAESSDAGIRARVDRTLAAHRELDLRSVTLDVHMKIVHMSGTVPTREMKHEIEQLLNSVPGVDQVIVNIVVP